MAIVDLGNSLMKKIVATLGLEGRHIQRIVIDVEVRNVVRVVVTELADEDQIDRVIELIDRAEKREVDPQDNLICKGDPRVEPPNGVIFGLSDDSIKVGGK